MVKCRVSTNNNKKHDNKSCRRNCCPCRDLGPEYLSSRYEVANILSDDGDSIVAPEYETTSEQYGPRKGQLFINADTIGEKLGDVFADIIKGNIKNVY